MKANHIIHLVVVAISLAACVSDDQGDPADDVSSMPPDLSAAGISNSYVTVYSDYDLPTGDFYNQDIDLTIENDPGTNSSLFYAYNFRLDGSGGYIGLQTGGSGKLAVFSIWDATGGTPGSSGSYCVPFDGEGVGHSCRMPYAWQEGHTYRLRVWAFDRNRWGGWILDRTTGVEVFLGTITTPSTTGYMRGDSSTFTEYYGPEFSSCNDLHYSRVRWARPSADNGSIRAGWKNNSIGNGACAHLRSSVGNDATVHTLGSERIPGCRWLPSGGALYRGQTLRSCDGRFSLVQQHDGNLVIYKGGSALWSTRTWNTTGHVAAMQSDGNFVLYNIFGQPLWHTYSWNNPGARLAMQDDGNLVVYATNGNPLWDSKTCCY